MSDARNRLAMLSHYLHERNQIIIDAYRAGVSKSEIHRITGLNRETVARILGQG